MAVLPLTSTTGDPVFRAQSSAMSAIKRFTRVASDASQKLTNQERIVSPGDDALSFSTSRGIRTQVTALKVVSETGQLNIASLSLAMNGLDGIKVQLDKLKKSLLNSQAAGTEERDQIQTQIDLSLSQIDSTARSTKMGSRSLLDGGGTIKAFQSIGTSTLRNDTWALEDSGQSLTFAAGIKAVRVNKVSNIGPTSKLIDGRTTLNLNVSIRSANKATKATLSFTAVGAGATDFAEFRVTGKLGSAVIRLSSTTANLGQMSLVTKAFNAQAAETGVILTSDATGRHFSSVGFGNDEFVRIELLDGLGTGGTLAVGGITSAHEGGRSRTEYGQAAVALVNGSRVVLGGEFGTTGRYIANGVDLEIDFRTFGLTTTTTNVTDTIAIDVSQATTGVVSASGSSSDVVSYGFQQMTTDVLGRGNGQWAVTLSSTGSKGALTRSAFGNSVIGNHSVAELNSRGRLSLQSGNLRDALLAVDRAIDQVIKEQTRLGTLQGNFIDAVNRAEVNVGNLTAADADIIGVDAASEITSLIQAQLGISTSSSVLSQANQMQAGIVGLLNG